MKKYVILLVFTLFLGLFSIKPISVLAQNDKNTLRTDRYFILEGEKFNPRDIFLKYPYENSAVYYYSEDEDISAHGTHLIHFVFLKKNKPIIFEDVELIVLSNEEYEDAIKYINYEDNNAIASNKALADLKGDGTITSAYKLAQDYIGMPGSCLRVATNYLNEYFNRNDIDFEDYKEVFVFEAIPGDLIYYVDGGIGIEHWAVYLGGDLALQGNYIGGTVIGKVYLNNASDPQFRRLN